MSKKKERYPVVVDFFCGAGGFTRGALDAGAYVLCGIDIDKSAKTTYEFRGNNRNPDGSTPQFIVKDIANLSYRTLKGLLKSFESHPWIFVGCPPCQPFTNLKTNKNRSEKDKGALSYFINLVVKLKPDYVVIENVPGIRAKKYGPIWEAAISSLNNSGYTVTDEIIKAKDFGIPQNRRRTILIAARTGQPPWPKPSHNNGVYRTVHNVISHLPPLRAGDTDVEDKLHSAARLSALNIKRVRAIKRHGGSRISWPSKLQLKCYQDHKGHTDVYGRMDWDKPAPTLTTRFVSLSNGRFGHPEQDRAISLREGALIQTFPSKYKFLAPSQGEKAQHIGNAVPPKLAKAIVKAIIKHILSEGDE